MGICTKRCICGIDGYCEMTGYEVMYKLRSPVLLVDVFAISACK